MRKSFHVPHIATNFTLLKAVLAILAFGISALSYGNEKQAPKLPSNIHDTLRIEQFYAQAGKYAFTNIDSATYFVEKGFKLSQKNRYMDGIGEGYGWFGFLSRQRGNLREAIDYNMKCLKIIQQQGYDSEYPRILNNLATLHLELENYEQAKRYYEECIPLNKESRADKSLASNYNNLALVYRNLNDFNNSYDYYQKAIDLRIKLKDSIGLASSYSNMGTLYEDQNNLKLALSFYLKSLTIRRLIDDRKGTAISLYKVGNIYLKKGDYEAALENAQEGYDIASKWGYKLQEKESSEVLYKVHKALNNAQKALVFFEIYNELADSLNNIELQKRVIESEYQLAYNKKYIVDSLNNVNIHVKNELLEKENALNTKSIAVQRLWLLIAALLVIGLITLLMLFRKNARAKEIQLRTDVRLRLSEVLALQNQLNQQEEQQQNPIEGVNIILNEKLTEREQEVLDALVFGLSNKEIGEKLFLSVNTIKTHINNLYVKLDVNNRTQAAVKGSLLKIKEQNKKSD